MNWDEYFLRLCEAVATKSPCLSRQVGSIIVRGNRVVATGYNGPPTGVIHCGRKRYESDDRLYEEASKLKVPAERIRDHIATKCPRWVLGYRSGEGLHLCPAAHAERNAITNAARLGVITEGTVLCLNDVVPCSWCTRDIINAGIKEIVCSKLTYYDDQSKWLLKQTDITVREFSF